MRSNTEEYIDRHDKTGEIDVRSELQKKADEIYKKRQAGTITRQEAADMMDNARGRLRY